MQRFAPLEDPLKGRHFDQEIGAVRAWYADDNVLLFQYQADADRFLAEFRHGRESSGWSYIQTKRAGLSSDDLPSETGVERRREA